MISGNSKQLGILAVIVVFLVAFLAYGNFTKKSHIDYITRKSHKQSLFSQDIVHKYQDCLRANQEWGAKFDSQRQVADDYKNKLESQEKDRQKSEKQLTESLATANSRIELLEGQQAKKLQSSTGKDASADNEAKQQKVKAVAATGSPTPTVVAAPALTTTTKRKA